MPGTIRIALTAPIHLLADDIVIRIPCEEELLVLEGRDVSPQLKTVVDQISELHLPPMIFSSRPYALTFKVDQDQRVYAGKELEDAINKIEETVLRIFPLRPSAEVVHSQIETFHHDGG